MRHLLYLMEGFCTIPSVCCFHHSSDDNWLVIWLKLAFRIAGVQPMDVDGLPFQVYLQAEITFFILGLLG